LGVHLILEIRGLLEIYVMRLFVIKVDS